MGVRSLHLLCILLFNILAAVVTLSCIIAVLTYLPTRSNARSAIKPLIELTDHRNDDGSEIYLWRIDQDEERRLSDLLQQDFYDVGMEGTLLNSPPHRPSLSTGSALLSSAASTLRSSSSSLSSLGNSPKGLLNDVYCSRCGHLTAFRNPTGDEGGVWHISHAPAYDRTKRTFAKREDVGSDASRDLPVREVELARASTPTHFPPTGESWARKRPVVDDSDAHADANDAGLPTPLAWIPGRWVAKREEDVAGDGTVGARAQAEPLLAGRSFPPRATPRTGRALAGLRRDNVDESAVSTAALAAPGWAQAYRYIWNVKREEGTPNGRVPRAPRR
ncbi:hypothetical protein C8Q80DRAFT_1124534 [Daedaleopsis nitida]|nr:hypothetical protein C8Q80DRAFT_1124534 [Daedaleopsis nitida]